jgi:hypothetical protein
MVHLEPLPLQETLQIQRLLVVMYILDPILELHNMLLSIKEQLTILLQHFGDIQETQLVQIRMLI